MVPELGHYALILALCLALLQAVVPLLGVARHQLTWMMLAKFTVWGQFIFIGMAFFALAYAFLSNDFSVAYVANNSNRDLPAIYRFCAIWGAHEGSMLLWVFILSIWMLAINFFSRSLPLEILARVLAVLAMISVGFLLFILITSNPFIRLLPNVPDNGYDLNPLLQDPGLVSHPPMLYLGYVGFSVAFAFAMAALMAGRVDPIWARWSRPWTLLAWCSLTVGITLGSWWAYRELGWGGWWFWDPVENASLMPWLAGTALLHSLMVTEQRHAFKAWTVLLAIVTFALSLLGTFLVRSGVLVSVHSFVADPSRGYFMLALLALTVGGSLSLYAWRVPKLQQKIGFSAWSRETFLLMNNIFLTTAMATVLLGTLYPLIISALGLAKISVGEPYFNSVFVPLMLPVLLIMGIAPLLRWRLQAWQSLKWQWGLVLVILVSLAFLLPWLMVQRIDIKAVVAIALAGWLIYLTGQYCWRQYSRRAIWSSRQIGMVLAHLGVAVCMLGIVLTSTYSQERDVRMAPGQVADLGSYQFELKKLTQQEGPNYQAIVADVQVSRYGLPIKLLQPEQRTYAASQTELPKTAIADHHWQDLYVALGEPIPNDPQGAWSLRLYVKPFVRWIWYGGLLMALGGLLAAVDKRYRLIKREKR